MFDTLLVVFGGHDGEKMLDDIYILDTGNQDVCVMNSLGTLVFNYNTQKKNPQIRCSGKEW
jgi:hypothetical protein